MPARTEMAPVLAHREGQHHAVAYATPEGWQERSGMKEYQRTPDWVYDLTNQLVRFLITQSQRGFTDLDRSAQVWKENSDFNRAVAVGLSIAMVRAKIAQAPEISSQTDAIISVLFR